MSRQTGHLKLNSKTKREDTENIRLGGTYYSASIQIKEKLQSLSPFDKNRPSVYFGQKIKVAHNSPQHFRTAII